MFGTKMKVVMVTKQGKELNVEMGPSLNEEEDAKAFVEWMNDPRVRYFLASPGSYSLSFELDWIRKQNEKEDGVTWFVYVDGRLTGSVGLSDINLKSGRASRGSVIGNKECWGQGIGPVAGAMVLEYAFSGLTAGGLHKVVTHVWTENERSLKAVQKVGFKEVGVHKDHLWRSGRWHDLWEGEIMQEDWQRDKEDLFRKLGITSYCLDPGCEDIGIKTVIVP